MDITYRRKGRRWLAEVWEGSSTDLIGGTFQQPYTEQVYTEINQWCLDRLGYHARTAYHIFEFKKRSDLDWFLLRWQ